MNETKSEALTIKVAGTILLLLALAQLPEAIHAITQLVAGTIVWSGVQLGADADFAEKMTATLMADTIGRGVGGLFKFGIYIWMTIWMFRAPPFILKRFRKVDELLARPESGSGAGATKANEERR